jgi:hypothetical protein
MIFYQSVKFCRYERPRIISEALPLLHRHMHGIYIGAMEFEWNESKNDELKERFGFGFERILVALGEDGLLDNRSHPNAGRYGHQRQLVVRIEAYAWIVPFVQDGDVRFLKTMFPSRKATKRYLEHK